MADETHDADQSHEPPHTPPAYERSDAHLGGILWAGIGLSIIVVAVLAICVAMFRYYVVRTGGSEGVIPPLPVAERGKLPPQPRLEGLDSGNEFGSSPELDTPPRDYGWVDQRRQIVRVPINIAMQLALKRLSGEPPAPADHVDSLISIERTQPPSAASSGRVLVPENH
jgi:hypothetical protein